MEVTNAVGGATAATILYGLIAFGGTLTLLDNLGLYDDVTDVVDEIKSFGGKLMFDRNTSKIGSMAVVTFMIISAVFAGGRPPRWTVRR